MEEDAINYDSLWRKEVELQTQLTVVFRTLVADEVLQWLRHSLDRASPVLALPHKNL